MLLDLQSQITEFITTHIVYFGPGYNVLNTLVFGIILGIIVILLIKMFRCIKKDPKDLIIPVIPFIFLGSSTRALVDNGIYPLSYLLITPGIYIITGLATIITLLVSVYIERKTNLDYRYLIFLVGVVICIPNILNISHINFVALAQVLGSWALLSSVFVIFRNKWSLIKDKFNLSVLLAHIFDASATFVAIDFYPYGEQHVLPNALIGLTGTALVMFPLKIIVILFALYVIDSYIEDKTIKNMLKLAILILGISTGLRDLLSLVMGT
ncbi:MAG: hypothetical protein A4E26_02299 [Methanobacterium sp. PtaU1.Bin097]|nr:MAG: hypothetical protein A4E26_02299 [Methanobacterium sp. PtaU1.Bin097]